LKKSDLSGLGTISFDYFALDDLYGKDIAFKFNCSNNKAITANMAGPLVTNSWTTRTLDLATATFYADGKTLTLNEWDTHTTERKEEGEDGEEVEVAEETWCSSEKYSVTSMRIGVGDNGGIDGNAQVFLDYLDFGDATQTSPCPDVSILNSQRSSHRQP
jgi:hypothetical protein